MSATWKRLIAGALALVMATVASPVAPAQAAKRVPPATVVVVDSSSQPGARVGGTSSSAAQPSASTSTSRVSLTMQRVDLDGPAIMPVLVTVSNRSASVMRKVRITFTGPVGWLVSEPVTVAKIAAGKDALVTFYIQVPERRPGFRAYEFTTTASYDGGDGAGTVTVTRNQTTGTPLANFAAARNKTSITALGATTKGDFDGYGNTFSAEQLAAAGYTPGKAFTALGANLTWPETAIGSPDSVSTSGQAIRFSGSGSKLVFVGSGASFGAAGPATVFYTDGTTSTGQFGFPNWSFQEATTHGATLLVATKGRNRPDGYGDAAYDYRVFANSIPLSPGKQIEMVILPASSSITVFAMAVAP